MIKEKLHDQSSDLCPTAQFPFYTWLFIRHQLSLYPRSSSRFSDLWVIQSLCVHDFRAQITHCMESLDA